MNDYVTRDELLEAVTMLTASYKDTLERAVTMLERLTNRVEVVELEVQLQRPSPMPDAPSGRVETS